jgi:hypothetical protein
VFVYFTAMMASMEGASSTMFWILTMYSSWSASASAPISLSPAVIWATMHSVTQKDLQDRQRKEIVMI